MTGLSTTVVIASAAAALPCAAQFVEFSDSYVDLDVRSYSADAGDLNGDGMIDVVLANSDNPTGTISVLLNSLAGFDAPVSYAAGQQPTVATLGDLDHDGDLDVVVSDFYGLASTISVLLNQGDGVFSDAMYFEAVNSSHMATLGDVDGDGNLDVIAPSGLEPRFSINLGDGAGGFGEPNLVELDGVPRHVELGDWDGDEDLDAAVALFGFAQEDNRVVIMSNNGSGVFSVADVIEVALEPLSIAHGDIDGDADPDLVVACYEGRSLSILVNDGQGAFAANEPLDLETRLEHVEFGDFDVDGDLDVAVTLFLSDGVAFLENDGLGAFMAPPVVIPTGPKPGRHAVADFDGDGAADLVVPSFAEELLVLRNENTCAADFNGDGSINILDFVAFQSAWLAEDPAADCDKNDAFNVLDFVCFQGVFGAGCG